MKQFGKDPEIELGRCRLLPKLRLLLCDGKKVDIGAKPLDVLLELAAAAGEVVSKDALLSRVWPDQIVEENNLQAHISAIRRALGVDRDLLTTEFGRGYRLKVSNAARDSDAAELKEADFDVPSRLSPLIGRASEIEDLAAAVAPGRVVTITGIGGIGKTKVAIELGHRLKAAFRDGIRFVELASVGQPELVLPMIAHRLSLSSAFEDDNTQGHGKRSDQQTLLILDSCEHALASVAQAIRRLREAVPGLAVLVTSQEPIDIDGEQVCRLQPLSVPPVDIQGIAEGLRYASIELLVQRIRAGEHTYKPDDTQAPDLCRICRQLDGIPLALELAAARVPLIGLRAVVTGLSDRFRLLTGGRRSAVPRHQTLRATLEWSYGLLKADEQRLLERLGLFAGSFGLPAVKAVAGLHAGDEWDVTDLLATLVSKSLVAADAKSANTRFYLYESMRAFALEKFASSRELKAYASRHAAYYRARLASAAKDWRMLTSEQWLQEYRDDLADVRAALDWTYLEEKDARVGAKLLCASLPFWLQLSLLDECRGRVEYALTRLKDENSAPNLEMQLQCALGSSLSWVRGPTPEAGKVWRRTLNLARQLEDGEHQAQAHYGLWLYALRSGSYGDSMQHAKALIEIGKLNDDAQSVRAGERTRGVSLHFLGRHAEGIRAIEKMLATDELEADQSFPLRFGVNQRIAGLAFLSRALWLAGNHAAAEAKAVKAVEEARQHNHITTLCCALLEGACPVAAFERDAESLRAHAEAASSIAERYNLGFWRAYAAAYQALALSWMRPNQDGINRLRVAAENLRRIHLHPGYAVFESSLAELLARQGHHSEAEAMMAKLIDAIDISEHWGAALFSKAMQIVTDSRDEV